MEKFVFFITVFMVLFNSFGNEVYKDFSDHYLKGKAYGPAQKAMIENMSMIPILNEYSNKDLKGVENAYAEYIILNRSLKQGSKPKINKLYNAVVKNESSNSILIEFKFLLLEALYAQRRTKGNRFKIEKLLNLCLSRSAQLKLSQRNKAKRRYYNSLEQRCIVNYARYKFMNKDYKGALEYYSRVDQSDFIWPYMILEAAWAHFHLGEYNRTLGILATYNAPLLKTYQENSEINYLRALTYYKLCLYGEAVKEINYYFDKHLVKNNNFIEFLEKNKNQYLFFYNLAFTPLKDLDKIHPFYRQAILQVSKKGKFIFNIQFLKFIEKESKNFKGGAPIPTVLTIRENLKRQIDYYIKSALYAYTNNNNTNAQRMLLLHSDILNNQRNNIYKNQKLVSNSARGTYAKAERKLASDDSMQFFTHENDYWKDEWLNATFGLKSNCQIIKD